jgi:hypothetical protein
MEFNVDIEDIFEIRPRYGARFDFRQVEMCVREDPERSIETAGTMGECEDQRTLMNRIVFEYVRFPVSPGNDQETGPVMRVIVYIVTENM